MKKKTMKRLKNLLGFSAVAVMLASLLAGCGNSSAKYDSGASYASDTAMAESSSYAYDMDYEDWGYEEPMEYEEAAMETGAEDVEVTEGGAQSKRKLIRTVNLDVETYDFDTITAGIAGRVSALGGYIETSSVDGSNNSTRRSATYTLRIPAANADSFIATVGANSNITHQSESMEDVTLQYVDIKSRKESLQVEYDRLEELLKDADGIEELIYIEERLSEVRYEIESIEAQLRSYDNLVDYTTIYLYISEVQTYTEPEPVDYSVGARIARGLKEAFENIVEFLGDLLVFIVVALPYLLVIAILVVLIWLIIKLIITLSRKYREKHPKKYKTPQPQAPQYVAQPGQAPAPAPAPAPAYVPQPADKPAAEEDKKADEDPKEDK
ncbi:MAG: DUF4349 domain-containing protein [Lachnospiraceae bacterium]|nr:DUF4349 domain-containing protein [Lachnospiraceae bacterium]